MQRDTSNLKLVDRVFLDSFEIKDLLLLEALGFFYRFFELLTWVNEDQFVVVLAQKWLLAILGGMELSNKDVEEEIYFQKVTYFHWHLIELLFKVKAYLNLKLTPARFLKHKRVSGNNSNVILKGVV